jgi:CHASE1-domain containing sensor protein/anti-sigma regulatory factor (Ser/Thr protein kinase)
VKTAGTPLLALLLTLLLTAAAALLLAMSEAERDSVRFEAATRTVENRIRVRMLAYIGVLRATEGFFAASETVDEDEFREFFRRIDVQADYPGIQGVGFAQRVAARELPDLVEDMRAFGISAFDVFPREPARPWYYPIVYLEPRDRRNLAALGYDMFSEPVRREAMERARDTGEAAMSARVRLVQELDEVEAQPGFLIYLPLYGEAQRPPPPDRREALLNGFVYSPFRAHDLFYAMFGSEPNPGIRFRIHDGSVPDSATLLYDSWPSAGEPDWASGEFLSVDTIPIAGRTWSVHYMSMPPFRHSGGPPLVPLILGSGLVLSLVLFGLTRAQANARARAERIEAARGRFYASMSHELRTPINAILGYIDLLLDGVYGPLNAGAGPRPRARPTRPPSTCWSWSTTCWTFPRSRRARSDLDFEPAAFEALVRGPVRDHAPAGPRARLGAHADRAAMPPVTTDPRRVRQILLNLLSNAIKFGARHPISCCASGSTAVSEVDVMDRGPGIPPRDLDRIFDEFVQLTAAAGEGTGLGLAISRRLAILLGGKLDVESEPGQGSTFALWLPLEPAGRTVTGPQVTRVAGDGAAAQ